MAYQLANTFGVPLANNPLHTDSVNWLQDPYVWQTARTWFALNIKEFAMSLVKIVVITIIVILSLLLFGRFFV